MLSLLAFFACAHAPVVAGSAVPEGVPAGGPSGPLDVQPDPAPIAPLPPVPEAVVADAAAPTDARQLANAWKVHHNDGVSRLSAGDAVGALAEARASLALAPADHRDEPLLLVALAAAAAGEIGAELDALEELAPGAHAPWGAFYNGCMDATSSGRPDLAHRFAQVALAHTTDVATVAPVALRAALAADQLDAALAVSARMPPTADPGARADLVRALARVGRCPDAKKLDPKACPAP